ncbi:MAG: acetylglutamate kinase [Candidatus Latescibacteria bacterium]|nr:acetylglutamate kinase [Candidatus Latescibacterota bacterium]
MQRIIEKASVLIEALPYIHAFRDKVVVVKYGGSAITEAAETDSTLIDIVFMATVGIKPVLIHGGGKEISRRMKEAGIPARFVNGLRVTDDTTMHIVEDVLYHCVNRDIVAAIESFGGKARGLSAKEAGIMHVNKHLPIVEDPTTHTSQVVDIGYVGDVAWIDAHPINGLCEQDIVPVVAPIGLGPDGRSYNVNADIAAGEIAIALKAEKLVFLTDVEGILRNGSLCSTVHVDEIEGMINDGTITGGMIPKVTACLRAVETGVRKIHIIDGRLLHSLLLEIYTDEGVGTQIVK